MFNYELYTLDEFLKDSWFREWVFDPTPSTEAFWTEWLRMHPDKQPLVDQARAMLRALEMPHRSITKSEIDASIDATFTQIHRMPRSVVLPLWRWQWVAAALVVLIGIGAYVALYSLPNLTNTNDVAVRSVPAGKLITQTNSSQQPKRIILPDGSQVVLSPSASLSYPRQFDAGERKTYLKGDAFFNITRNLTRPFLIVTDKLVTRVLGTSFWIRANPVSEESRVIVRTGKVSVFRTDDLAQTSKKPEGVLLLPNQQAVFQEETNRLTKSLVEQPVQIQQPEHKRELHYSEVSASQIFNELAQIYGIQIVYDEEMLKQCQITATLGDEPFFDTLRLLCNTIHASYEVIDTHVVIYSKGCD